MALAALRKSLTKLLSLVVIHDANLVETSTLLDSTSTLAGTLLLVE